MFPRDLWYVVADAREVVAKRPLPLTAFGERLVLWRDAQGQVRAARDHCPHRGAALSIGEVHDGQLMCPFHGFRFDGGGACTLIPSGECIPPGMRLEMLPAREAHGWIYLWWGEAERATEELPWFPEAEADGMSDDLPTAFFSQDWPVHWTRAVENQLDSTHLPFVHATTIGRFVPEPETTMQLEVGEGRMRYFFGQREAQYIEWAAPNVWRNKVGPKMWIHAAFVPIDEQTSRTYVRYCQGMLTVPLLGEALCWLMNPFNKIILEQDRRVVSTQRPIATRLSMGERLLASDRPIIEFRKWMHRAMGGEEGPAGPRLVKEA